MKAKRAMIAMSGGVDSSVAALLMQEQGYDCAGITMRLCHNRLLPEQQESVCCSLSDVEDARSVCLRLNIPFFVYNFTDEFEACVVKDFVDAYARGETPNPCIVCNRELKFGRLMERARLLGFDTLVTGHYARTEQDSRTGRWLLKTGLDRSKDQSYMLYTLTQEQLAYVRFPLGGLTKEESRALALKADFLNAEKPDSQDICFVPDGDYPAFLARYRGREDEPGDFLTLDGKVCGRHRGQEAYTVGQRRGLRLAMGEPVYVIRKNAAENTVTVGPDEALYSSSLIADRVSWIVPQPVGRPFFAEAKTRYRQPPVPVSAVWSEDQRLHLHFERPVRAITPGQAVVLYDGDTVLGGGTILSSQM